MHKQDSYIMKFFNHIFNKHRSIAVSILAILAFVVLMKVFAATPYAPSATLDPATGPGDSFVQIFPSNASGFLKNNGSGTFTWDTPSAGISGSGTTDRVTKWTGSGSIGNGPWAFSGNTLYPVLDSSGDLGSATNRISNLYLSAFGTINYGSASSLIFSEAGSEKMRIAFGGNVGIGTTAPGSKLELKGGPLRLSNTFGGFVDFQNSSAMVGSYTFTLPPNAGTSGQILSTNGSGTTSWITPAGGGGENPLTFSTGLTRTVDTITNNLSTGVSGGQSVFGGTGATQNLTLSSTSFITKGNIIFGTSAYDELNNRLGIGTTTPGQALEVANGGVRLNNTTAVQPACTSTTRGTFWVSSLTPAVKDDVQVCAKDASDVYAWRVIY